VVSHLNTSMEITRAVAFGYSQSGRFLKTLLHEHGNLDPADGKRKLFDLVVPFVSGSRLLSLTQPFPFPGRFPRDFEDHDYVTPDFGRPYSYLRTEGDDGGRILDRCESEGSTPLIVHVDSANEFWQGWSSLGERAVDSIRGQDSKVRKFLLASVPHSPGSGHDVDVWTAPWVHRLNRADYRPAMRAIVSRSLDWVAGRKAMLPSAWPDVARGELAPAKAVVRIMADQPKELVGHLPSFPGHSNQPGLTIATAVPVPRAPFFNDPGVELACLAVPLGTHTGWNARKIVEGHALGSAAGSWFPFSKVRIQELYPGGKREYLDKSRLWIAGAVGRGWLLERDEAVVMQSQEKEWDAVIGPRAKI
jgi:hypothetical protein